MATRERSGFVKDDLDALQAQVSIEQVCTFYGVETGELRQIGAETRAQCFLNCGKSEPTGDRALAIRSDGVKRWHCHEYSCGKGGNLIGLCNYLKEGIPEDGQPHGERFKQILLDLKAIVGGVTQQTTEAAKEQQVTPPSPDEPKINVLLKDNEKKQARNLVTLDEKFLVVPNEKMNRHAASYQRQRPFLTPELCRKERCGYLPLPGSGGDRRGGTLQGKWVYCYADEQGEPLAWFGRNLRYEEQLQEWITSGHEGKKPEKFHFVKGFHRSIELYGQHEWNIETIQQKIRNEIGALLLVEGPNDRIALKSLGVPAFAICSNRIAAAQTARVAAKANEIGVPVGLLFDNDAEGESGAKQGAYDLAQLCPVRVLWSPTLFDGKFRNRQPESLTSEEWQEIHAALQCGGEG